MTQQSPDAERATRDELFARKLHEAWATHDGSYSRFWEQIVPEKVRRLLEEAEAERDEAVAAGQEIARDLANALNERDRALRVVEAAQEVRSDLRVYGSVGLVARQNLIDALADYDAGREEE